MTTQLILYSLACDHVARASSTLVSGMLYCPWCQDHSQVIGVVQWEWRAHCETCRFSRWCGLSEGTAGHLANGHYRRHTTHTVYPEYVINPEAKKTKEKMDGWNAKKS